MQGSLLRFVKRQKWFGSEPDPRARSEEKRQPIRFAKTIYILQYFDTTAFDAVTGTYGVWLDVPTVEETPEEEMLRVRIQEARVMEPQEEDILG